jgi:hypothetical protein
VPSLYGRARPPTIFFDYPSELCLVRQPAYSQLQDLGARRLVYFSKWERNCVKNTFARAGFVRTKNGAADGGWNAFWGHHSTHAELSNMNKYQRVSKEERQRHNHHCLRTCSSSSTSRAGPLSSHYHHYWCVCLTTGEPLPRVVVHRPKRPACAHDASHAATACEHHQRGQRRQRVRLRGSSFVIYQK